MTGYDHEVDFAYDAQGRRTSKTVNGVTTTYTYSGNLMMQLSKAGKTLQFVYDAGGTALGFKAKETGAMYYYIRNLQGDVIRIADEEGVGVTSYTYDPWGFMTGSGGNAYLALNPFRYRGYLYDTETGLYFLQTRFYDPQVKRFLNADSLFIAGDEVTGANMYAYCNGNPVMYSDPSGMASERNRGNKALGTILLFMILITEFNPFAAAAGLVDVNPLIDLSSIVRWAASFMDEAALEMAGVIYGEAGRSSFPYTADERNAVGWTIINRVNSSHYEEATVSEVLNATYKGSDGKTYYHYNAYKGENYNSAMDYYLGNAGAGSANTRAAMIGCLKAAIVVYYNLGLDPTGGAVAFNESGKPPSGMKIYKDIRDTGWKHYFYGY